MATKHRILAISLATATLALATPTDAGAGGHRPPPFTPGAAGVGDPYFPLDGNGGYDVLHYDLDITYDPATDALQGVATILASATQNLSAFNLDLHGLDVRSVKVNLLNAGYSRSGDELTVVPRFGLLNHLPFLVVVRYDGIPVTLDDSLGLSGVFHTDDGAVIIGQPHVASTWYPVNDHPTDAASYSFEVKVPTGLEAVANGVLTGSKTRNGWTTWSWEARDPMASYLATATIGEFDLHAYKVKGIKYWDAIDPDLFAPALTPHTGEQVVVSDSADFSYKRLTREITVPTGGATLSFWVARATEPGWDFFFVEARTAGGSDWTTLAEDSGNTSGDTGASCPGWHAIHPFLANYQTDNGDGSCSPVGTPPATGAWNAVTGQDGRWTRWSFDLGAYAGSVVEVSLAYASDDVVQFPGVAIDDIEVSTGEGSTSFENDADVLDGWTVPGPPPGSPGNANDWRIGTQSDLPAALGPIIQASFDRQPEIIDFLSSYFGRYPWNAAGGIVDDIEGLGFALENQTRPIYALDFFTDSVSGDSVIVHELAHQWFGDNLRLGRWTDIWLNEGFATYAEWLWSEREGLGTAQELYDFYTTVIEEDNPFWQLSIGDPGPDLLFDISVYYRGAMTLHSLRLTVGDGAFFTILRTWAKRHAGDTVSTPEFIALAERISHQQLDDLFNAWLYTPGKPAIVGATAPAATSFSVAAATSLIAPPIARAQLQRMPIAGVR